MRVEVVYAAVAEQTVLEVELAPGATVGQAIRACGILERFPQIDITRAALGIFGERATLNDTVQDGDRVEIYRPLVADPKQMRARRARTRR